MHDKLCQKCCMQCQYLVSTSVSLMLQNRSTQHNLKPTATMTSAPLDSPRRCSVTVWDPTTASVKIKACMWIGEDQPVVVSESPHNDVLTLTLQKVTLPVPGPTISSPSELIL